MFRKVNILIYTISESRGGSDYCVNGGRAVECGGQLGLLGDAGTLLAGTGLLWATQDTARPAHARPYLLRRIGSSTPILLRLTEWIGGLDGVDRWS